MGLLERLLRRVAPGTPPVHVSDSAHRWEPIRRGYESAGPFVCKCGALGVRSIRAGKNTVTMGPASGIDVIRWSASFAPVAAGDIGMNVTTGRPRAFMGRDQQIPGALEAILSRNLVLHQPRRGATTIDSLGDAAPTTEGTATTGSGGGNHFIRYDSAAVLNSNAGWLPSAFAKTIRDASNDPVFDCTVVPISTTVLRYWVGLFSADPMASGAPALNFVGFRFDTSLSDVNWKCVNGNGASTAVVDSGVAMAGSSEFHFRIMLTGTGGANVLYFINGSLVASFSGSAPGIVALGFVAQVRTLEAVAKAIGIHRISLVQGAPSIGNL